ncbi:MAG: DEAD/DEAH box helicase [Patescibacteria group bacterium]
MFNNRQSSFRRSNSSGRSFGRPPSRGYGQRSAQSGESRDGFANRSYGSSRPTRFGGNRRFAGGGRGGGRGAARGRNMGQYIPREKYIKKASLEIEPKVDIPVSYTPFSEMNLSQNLKSNISQHGYEKPMPIQNATIPYILEGKDVVGIANTGTGKTGAFLIPILEKMTKRELRKAIIIVPTRELAQQIFDEFKYLSYRLNIFAAVCIGGSSMNFQMRQLRRNPRVIIGTPGRLKDFVSQNVLRLNEFDTVVLDEVDRMMDMGFIHDITHLLSQLPAERLSLFFSATITPEVSRTIEKFSKSPITVSVKTHETSDFVEQDIVVVKPGENKIDKLAEILERAEVEKVLVFGRTKRGVEKLAKELYQREFKAVSIHGDKTQRKREEAIRLFKDNKADILVATDVAARGIDIADITHVINFDEPATYEDYTHRIGRTGRAHKKGFAYTFVAG